MKRLLRGALLVGGVTASLGGHAALADVILSGPDGNDGDYSTSALAAAATAGDTVTSGGATGISVWGLLGGSTSNGTPTVGADGSVTITNGAIITNTPAGDYNTTTSNPNQILRYYLLGTNAAGAASVISLGEIDPGFGGTAPLQPFVSYTTSTPNLIVPGAPARDLTNLTSLQLLAVPALPVAPEGVQSTGVVLSSSVTQPGTYNTTGTPAGTIPFTTNTPQTSTPVTGDTYTGVSLFGFIDPTDSDINDQIVDVVATDDYQVVLSLAELDDVDPGYDGNPGNLLAYADTTGAFPNDGIARILLPGDNKHGRWDSNLVSIDVSTVPEPGSLTLMAAGLLSLGLVRRRARRGGAL